MHSHLGSHARHSEESYRMLAGLLLVTGVVELIDFLIYLYTLYDAPALGAVATALSVTPLAAFQRAFFLALFTGILGGTCLWLGLRIQKRALATPHTVEETRTALAYTTVALLAYGLYYASQAAFLPAADPLIFIAALYTIIAALIFHWAR